MARTEVRDVGIICDTSYDCQLGMILHLVWFELIWFVIKMICESISLWPFLISYTKFSSQVVVPLITNYNNYRSLFSYLWFFLYTLNLKFAKVFISTFYFWIVSLVGGLRNLLVTLYIKRKLSTHDGRR